MEKSDVFKGWRDQKCVIATMHNKELVTAPLLQSELGVQVFVPENFDTDSFGTFTRETNRAGNQLEAARKKALGAMKLTGAQIGFASEGSFGAHPVIPFMHSSLEIVVLIDSIHNLEIVGNFRSSEVQVRGQDVSSPAEVIDIAHAWGFPKQGVILRQSATSNRHIYKELSTDADLKRISEQLLAKFFVKSVCIETDMRAHRCPQRMESIKMATLDLIKNCKKLCPICTAPGFVTTDVVRGLLCSQCSLPTELVKETIHTCQKCSHTENRPVESKTLAEPGECQWCNP
jgi:hypothetical protein